jgi:hypothetical protein
MQARENQGLVIFVWAVCLIAAAGLIVAYAIIPG